MFRTIKCLHRWSNTNYIYNSTFFFVAELPFKINIEGFLIFLAKKNGHKILLWTTSAEVVDEIWIAAVAG